MKHILIALFQSFFRLTTKLVVVSASGTFLLLLLQVLHGLHHCVLLGLNCWMWHQCLWHQCGHLLQRLRLWWHWPSCQNSTHLGDNGLHLLDQWRQSLQLSITGTNLPSKGLDSRMIHHCFKGHLQLCHIALPLLMLILDVSGPLISNEVL